MVRAELIALREVLTWHIRETSFLARVDRRPPLLHYRCRQSPPIPPRRHINKSFVSLHRGSAEQELRIQSREGLKVGNKFHRDLEDEEIVLLMTVQPTRK